MDDQASQDDSMMRAEFAQIQQQAQLAEALAQAEFWKLRYLELFTNTQQVISLLNAPMLQEIQRKNIQQRLQQFQQATQQPDEPEAATHP